MNKLERVIAKVLFLFSILAIFSYNTDLVKAETPSSNMDIGVVRSVPTEIVKNVRKTNFKVLRDWYFVHEHELGFDTPVGGFFKRRYHIYWRNVSYTLEYDVYSATGTFLRHERQHYANTLEEDWRLVK